MIKLTRVLHYRAYQRFNASLREKDPRSEISLTKQVPPEEILILQQAVHSINLANRGDILESDAPHACKASVLPSNDRPPEIV